MKRLIAIVGIPGTGKTTIMREFMSDRDWVEDKPIDLLDSHVSGDLRVLGKYEDGQTFAGTDRLSMAVVPKAIEFLLSCSEGTVIFEGDRLSSIKLLNAAKDDGWDLKVLHVFVSDEERERRYKERGSNQDEKFINGRKTKVKNIVEEFGPQVTLFGEEDGCVTELVHEDSADTRVVVDWLKHYTSQ